MTFEKKKYTLYNDDEQSHATLQSAEYITRIDITELLIQTRDEAALVWRALKSRDRVFMAHWRNFLEMFYKIYNSLRYNIPQTHKVPDWEDKVPLFKRIFKDWDRAPPEFTLLLWEYLFKACVDAGIYNLTQEYNVGFEGFKKMRSKE